MLSTTCTQVQFPEPAKWFATTCNSRASDALALPPLAPTLMCTYPDTDTRTISKELTVLLEGKLKPTSSFSQRPGGAT